jgi:hypothetical protein
MSNTRKTTLARPLADAIDADRYPFSPRIRTLRGILAKLRPEPARVPLPPPKVYAPPSKGPILETRLECSFGCRNGVKAAPRSASRRLTTPLSVTTRHAGQVADHNGDTR